ncbi:hypothetical protein OQA88_8709 [Cercophora sp. LCS_1]
MDNPGVYLGSVPIYWQMMRRLFDVVDSLGDVHPAFKMDVKGVDASEDVRESWEHWIFDSERSALSRLIYGSDLRFVLPAVIVRRYSLTLFQSFGRVRAGSQPKSKCIITLYKVMNESGGMVAVASRLRLT